MLASQRQGTVVVSAAAGSVGSLVGQIAKIHGCRVIGVAGGPEKCAYVTDELGFDGCIDYKKGGLDEASKAACPEGIDVYFDNVGGAVLDAVLANLSLRARIVICGLISSYNEDSVPGPKNFEQVLIAGLESRALSSSTTAHASRRPGPS